MKVNLRNYKKIDVGDICQQIELISTDDNINQLRTHALAIAGSIRILVGKSTDDRKWHIEHINKNMDLLEQKGIIFRSVA